jgi:hypothetical protein
VETPVRVYQYRERPLVRFVSEALAGLVAAVVVIALPALIAAGAWPPMVILVATAAVFIRIAVGVRLLRRARILLYEDRVVRQGAFGVKREIPYIQIREIVPGAEEYGEIVLSSHERLWITPDIEGFSDLRRRLAARHAGAGSLPPTREPWRATTVYTYRYRMAVKALLLAVIAYVCGSVGRQAYKSDYTLFGWIFLAVAGLSALAAIWLLLVQFVERIEIRDDHLVWISPFGTIWRRVPTGRILGGVLRESRGYRKGAIDTDDGEIRFSSDLKNAADLVAEAERLGAARLAQANRAAQVPKPAKARVSTR